MKVHNDQSKLVNEPDGPQEGSILEILLVSSIGPLSVMLRNLAIPWIFFHMEFVDKIGMKVSKLVLDQIFLVCPTVLSLTILSNHCSGIVFTLTVSCLLLLICKALEYYHFAENRTNFDCRANSANRTTNLYFDRTRVPTFLIYFRACVYIATAVSILAVDFPCFPRRFAKTSNYGFSLMDTGVGVFAFLFGVTSPEFRKVNADKNFRFSTVFKPLPLLLLGLLRLLFVKLLNYHENLAEYGVHWNFFFTLAAVKTSIIVLSCIFDLQDFSLALSVLIVGLYQTCIYVYSIDLWIFGEHRDYGSFVDSNREGICSLTGYVALTLAGGYFGQCIFHDKPQKLQAFWTIFSLGWYLAFFGLTLTYALSVIGPPSRRLASLTYYLWIVVFSLFHLIVFQLMEKIAEFASFRNRPIVQKDAWDHSKNAAAEPCLLHLISMRGLFYFLIANILTGVVNLCSETKKVNGSECVCYLLAYCAALSGLLVAISNVFK